MDLLDKKKKKSPKTEVFGGFHKSLIYIYFFYLNMKENTDGFLTVPEPNFKEFGSWYMVKKHRDQS